MELVGRNFLSGHNLKKTERTRREGEGTVRMRRDTRKGRIRNQEREREYFGRGWA